MTEKGNRRKGSVRRAVLAGALLGILAAPAAPAQDGAVPDPETGRWALTTFALLRYQRNLCDGIAGKVLGRWRRLDGDSAAAQESMRRFVVEQELTDLAAGRAAADVARRFLPAARDEVEPRAAAALERLLRLEGLLCDAVAYPTAPRAEFEAGVRDLLDRIEREEVELGRMLVVTAGELETILEPYLPPLQIAGVEAEGEYRDYLDSLETPPELPSLEQLMGAWHRRYSEAARPTKRALGKYLAARRATDARARHAACREILAAVIPLLRDRDLFRAPDPKVRSPLERAFVELRQMATHCNAGRSFEVEQHFGEMQRQLAAAARLLAPYSLKP